MSSFAFCQQYTGNSPVGRGLSDGRAGKAARRGKADPQGCPPVLPPSHKKQGVGVWLVICFSCATKETKTYFSHLGFS